MYVCVCVCLDVPIVGVYSCQRVTRVKERATVRASNVAMSKREIMRESGAFVSECTITHGKRTCLRVNESVRARLSIGYIQV